nr:hypothetical protein [Actinomycetota bacterium]
MKKTIGMLGLGLVVGALGIGPSIASASSLAPSTTLKLTGQPTAVQLIEEGKKGFSLGDRIILGGVLLEGGKPVGHFGIQDVAANTQPKQVEEFATFILGGGQLTFQDMRRINATDFTVAITGGTGAYEGARGQAEVHVTK